MSHGLLPRSGWVLWVSEASDPEWLAEALHRTAPDLKPVAIQPGRLMDAIATIRPVLIVIDSRLPAYNELVRRATEQCAGLAVVVSDHDLAGDSGGGNAEQAFSPTRSYSDSSSGAACRR